MSDEFASPDALMWSAHKHISALERLIKDAFSGSKARPVEEIDPQTGYRLWKVQFAATLDPEIPLLIFNASTELRAALDHAVYAGAVALGERPSPTKTAFPFKDLASELPQEIESRCKHVPVEIIEVIEELEPYEAGNASLWRLNKLRNFKDHRRLIRPTGAYSGKCGLTVTKCPNPEAIRNEFWQGESPTEFYFLSLPPDTEARFDLTVSFSPQFADDTPLHGWNVIDFMWDAWRAVEAAVQAFRNRTSEVLAERAS